MQKINLSTQILIKEAKKIGIKTKVLVSDKSIVEYKKKDKTVIVRATLHPKTSYFTGEVAKQKELAKFFWKRAGLPIAKGDVCGTFTEAKKFIQKNGFPVVIKPLSEGHGHGVSANLKNFIEVKAGIKISKKFSEKFIIEKFIEGVEFRVIVLGDKAIATTNRVPARIFSDGRKTIRQLIDQVNKDTRRGDGNEKPMSIIIIDEEVKRMIKRAGFTMKSIPLKGTEIYLRQISNISAGGEAVDKTNVIHPDNAKIAIKACQVIGLYFGGVDIITSDISKSIIKNGGALIEVNSVPGIFPQHMPAEGESRNIAKLFLESLFD